ncbi:MAG: hypothetical protein KAQ75_10760, partial [Bacteroidales bacterium]|nr:hypothetical protein [Bacteroidales bacterium]
IFSYENIAKDPLFKVGKSQLQPEAAKRVGKKIFFYLTFQTILDKFTIKTLRIEYTLTVRP